MKTKTLFFLPLVASAMILPTNCFAAPLPNSSNLTQSTNSKPQKMDSYTKEEVAGIVAKASLLGRKFTDKCEGEIRAIRLKGESVCLENIKLFFIKPVVFRVIKPNMSVTMDFSPNRINITLDSSNVITDVAIG